MSDQSRGRGRGRAQAYMQKQKRPRKDNREETPPDTMRGPSGMSSSRSASSLSEERGDAARPRGPPYERGEASTSGSGNGGGKRKGRGGDQDRGGDQGRGGESARSGESSRSSETSRSGENSRSGEASRSGESSRNSEHGRHGNSSRNGDYSRSGEHSRSGESSRSDHSRSGDYSRSGNSRPGEHSRSGESGRGEHSRSGDYSRSGNSRPGEYGRSGESGRGEHSRGGEYGRGGEYPRSGEHSQRGEYSRSGESSRGGDYSQRHEGGRDPESGRGGGQGRGDPGEGNAGAVVPVAAASAPVPVRPQSDARLRKGVLKTRPDMCVSKRGCTGREVTLQSNYFKIDTLPNWTIYQYRTEFNVEGEHEFQKKAWLREHVNVIGRAYIFDGTMLFSTKLLTEGDKPLVLTSIRELDQLPVKIEIRFIQKVSYGNHIYLQVFNILVRRSLSFLKLQLVHRNYFDALAAIQLPQLNMEIWPGYITSIKQNEASILMCAELTHKIMRKDTARDLLLECVKQSSDYKMVFQQAMSGQVVLTDYNNKTYKIEDVDFTSTPESTFKLRNDEVISFVDYYERRYKIRIRDVKQPLLIAYCNQPTYRDGVPTSCLLIPELCRMTGLDDKMSDSAKLKKTLSEYTRISPSERMRRVLSFNQRLQDSSDVMREFDLWDMRLSRSLLQVPGRELPPETIIGGDGEKYSAGRGTDWIREVRSRPMLKNAVFRDWAVIFPSFLGRDVTTFLDALKKAGLGMNFRLPAPKMCQTPSDRPSHFVDAVEELLGRGRYDLILFVCSNNRADRYNAIKRKCCVDRGVQSQVILSKNLKGKGLSVATKVAIQLNCKLGGAPWSIDIPLQNVMVIGYDVCHDTKNKTKSYGAVVASLNNTLSSWYSVVNHHTCGEEVSNGLAADIGKALMKYKQLNGCLPLRIFVYRDGVGEGQLNFVYEHEVKCLKTALTSIYSGDSWKLGYIIVSKRIHTRLFKGDANPAAGTVIDDVITLPERYDFFLISQNVNAGTVTPTNYNVISDNLGLKPDQIQRWTYKMTHLYYNWSGTVRVPAPCQYAHKLAFLVGQSLHVPAHSRLSETLYFL